MTKIIIILALLHCIKAESFVQNNIGRLHLSDRKWEIQYILNLTEYKETTKLLQECIDTLSTICENGQNPLCPIFLSKSCIFEIVDYEFLNTMENINDKLKPNFMLPPITSMVKNDFFEINTDINDTHLMISIDLPVANRAGFDIHEFKPIPMREKDTLYMLNIKTTKYYVKNLKIHILSDDILKSLCKSQDKTTICNNFIENYTQEPPTCIRNLILNTDVECEYKQIQY